MASLTNSQIQDCLLMMASARCRWNVQDFSKAAYGDDYDREHEGRQAYLDGKYKVFREDPLRAFQGLDLSLQDNFITFLRNNHGHRNVG